MAYVLSISALAFAALSLCVPAAAQHCALAVDINRSGREFASDPGDEGYVQAGPYTYFFATSPAEGRELWRTDGTTSGTVRLTDLVPGVGSSAPNAVVGPVMAPYRLASGAWGLVFAARSVATGEELWVTDGTRAGTSLLADIRPGAEDSFVRQMASLRGKVYFAAFDDVHGFELWETDGSAAGTRLVADLIPGPGDSSPYGLTGNEQTGQLFFSVRLPGIGAEPHVLDTATGSVSLLADVNPGPGNSGADDWIPVGAETAFTAFTPTNGTEIWFTDGTTAGTRLVRDVRPGSESSIGFRLDAVALGGRLVFAADDGATGVELWESDGTAAGTVPRVELVPGPGSAFPNDLASIAGGSILAFVARTPSEGAELWLWNGQGPQVVDIAPGSTSSRPRNLLGTNDGVLFSASISGVNRLAHYEASTAALTLLGSIQGPGPLGAVGMGHYVVTGGTGSGREPHVTDLTSAGTGLLREIGVGQETDGSGVEIKGVAPDGWMMLAAQTSSTLFRPWAWRPGMANAIPLLPGQGIGPQVAGPVLGSTDSWSLVYTRLPGQGLEPYVWQRDAQSMTQLRDIWPGNGSSVPTSELSAGARVGDRVVFAAADGQTGRELWVTDGTSAGTQLLRDLWPGASAGLPEQFVHFRGRVYFVARDGVNGQEVWVTDGTAAGTHIFVDLEAGIGAQPTLFEEFDGKLWFAARTSAAGVELWCTDGTPAGTRLAIDLVPGPASSLPESFAAVGDSFAFTAQTPATGVELFASDGTAGGTRLVADVAPGSASGCAGSELRAATHRVYFDADDGTVTTLWVSDLTAAGTGPVLRANAAERVAVTGSRAVVGDRLYFLGTGAGLRRVLMVAEGDRATEVCGGLDQPRTGAGLAPFDGALFAVVDTVAFGEELHQITDPGAMVEDLGDRCGPAWARLEATPPTLGGSTDVRGSLAPQGAFGATLIALAAPRTALVTLLEPGCYSHALPFDSALPITFTATWQDSVPIPAFPALSGLQVVVQTYYLSDPSQPVVTSNAVRLTVGR